ncbi:hypothetical protein B0I35DRAFT_447371 [Stachybotrys elegans]|uniref:Calcium uniporter protein n=1 Tax=Stachybotrys elegans TaxID=80388 RepID=A0A8K0WJK2_9HYPO|nr:hypothetical protein B0I35DRAFT_447371 [Stachybotrys elegans]
MSSDDQAETTALLFSLQSGSRSPKPCNTMAISTYMNNRTSERLQLILSQCETLGDIDSEMWDDFEIHRRGAETYLNQYIDALEKTHKVRGRYVWEDNSGDEETLPPADVALGQPHSDPEALVREQSRLNISHDSLEWHLRAMQETLGFLKSRLVRSTCKPASHFAAASTTVVATASWLYFESSIFPVMPFVWVTGMGIIGYCYKDTATEWIQKRIMRWRQEIVEDLLKKLYQDKIIEADRENLKWLAY